jgi:uncharacterized protein
MEETVPIREGIFAQTPGGVTLLGNRCTSCRKVLFPKAQPCPNCLHEELEELALSRHGRLCSYTIVHMPTVHFKPPYAVGWVELPEGVRVFAPLDMMEGKPFRVGMDMEVRVDPLWKESDTAVIGYRFMPI